MRDNGPVEAFSFAFEPPLDTWARWFAIVPTRSFVRVDDHGLEAVYGSWRVATTWSNVCGVERTGPYRPWKVAGPVRLSLADRGLTMAATTAGGVCLRLHDPIPGLDPLRLFRHPTVTLGVEDVDGFVRAIEARLETAQQRAGGAAPPSHERGSVGGTWAALRDWRRRSVDLVDLDVDQVSFPEHDRARDADDQPREIGVGPTYHRTYRLDIDGAARSVEDAMAEIRADPNALADSRFAPFTKARGRSGEMVVGDRYVIQLAGPWKGAVEVIEVSPRSFRFATLEGHMESGVIEMRAVEASDTRCVQFTIESWARSHDRAFDLIYDKIGLGRMLQGEMWAIACDRFAQVVAGTPNGAMQVATERHAGGC